MPLILARFFCKYSYKMSLLCIALHVRSPLGNTFAILLTAKIFPLLCRKKWPYHQNWDIGSNRPFFRESIAISYRLLRCFVEMRPAHLIHAWNDLEKCFEHETKTKPANEIRTSLKNRPMSAGHFAGMKYTLTHGFRNSGASKYAMSQKKDTPTT